jgi:hypothetical protein
LFANILDVGRARRKPQAGWLPQQPKRAWVRSPVWVAPVRLQPGRVVDAGQGRARSSWIELNPTAEIDFRVPLSRPNSRWCGPEQRAGGSAEFLFFAWARQAGRICEIPAGRRRAPFGPVGGARSGKRRLAVVSPVLCFKSGGASVRARSFGPTDGAARSDLAPLATLAARARALKAPIQARAGVGCRRRRRPNHSIKSSMTMMRRAAERDAPAATSRLTRSETPAAADE